METKFGKGGGKIRKRACSSSPSSSLVRRYRFKRAISAGKRGSVVVGGGVQMAAAVQSGREIRGGKNGGGGADNGVLARKSAATLWEVNDSPSPEVTMTMMKKKKGLSSDPSYSPVSERIDRPEKGGHRRRASGFSQITDYNLGAFEPITNANLIEMETNPRVKSPCGGHVAGQKHRLKDVRNCLVTSKELLKVLNRLLVLEDRPSSSASLASAMNVELDRARFQADQLIREQRSYRSEVSHYLKQLAEENAASRGKERERIRDALATMGAELEVEQKLRRQTERLNKKLGKELMDTKTSLLNTLKELQSEKRAKDVLEQVCDELAKGIGEDRAEVEELKRESAKMREDVEKEREMLQLADILREERVQMKLSEAKFHFEEKNAAVDKLKNKLQSYMCKKVRRLKGDESPESERIKELRIVLRNAGIDSFKHREKQLDRDQDQDQDQEQEQEQNHEDREEEEEEESAGESDLHSIELNMGKNNGRKSYEWNFASGESIQDDSRRSSVEVFKGRRSLSEKIQWGSICLNKGSSGALQCEFIATYHENLDGGVYDERVPNVSSKDRS